MRLTIIPLTLFTAAPALAHGNHLLPSGGHDHGAGMRALLRARTGRLAGILNRKHSSRTGAND